MGLLDGYSDPQQFAASGGLLGRLLSLQPQYAENQQGAGFSQPSPIPPTSAPVAWPSPTSAASGQPPSASQTSEPDLHPQYQALRPILGDFNAMLATVHPEVGQSLIAQATANQPRENAANVVQAGYRLGGIPLPFPQPAPGPQPQIPMPAIPDWWKVGARILQLLPRVALGLGGGGDNDDCKEEKKKAREICVEAYANGWKSDFDVGPYKTPWTIDDCMRGLISERCGGNRVDK